MSQFGGRSRVNRAFEARHASKWLLALLTMLNAESQSRVEVSPVRPDRVSYSTFAPGRLDIYLFERTGEPPRQLTDHPALDYDAVVSPNGRWLVFCSERGGDPDLYVLDLEDDGGEPKLLVDSEALEDQAAFSPDGRTIAFVSTAAGNADIYTLPFTPADTTPMSDARNLTNNPGGDFRPAFSPDGRTLAFSSDRGLPITTPPDALRSINRLRSADVYTVDLASLTATRLTDAPGWDGSPVWSPDGTTIMFYSELGARLDHLQTGLFAMSADGSNRRPIVSTGVVGALSPKFLSDGRIVFARRTKPYANGSPFDEGGSWQIASVAADGSGLRIESDDGTNNYWGPTPGPRPQTIVAYGAPAPSAPTSDSVGSFLVGGAPFMRTVLGRSVELFPVRPSLGSVLHPLEPILLRSDPPGAAFTVSTMDGNEQNRIVEFSAPRNRPFGFNYSRDGAWIVFSRGGSAAIFGGASDGDVWKMRSDGTELTNLTLNSPEDDGYPSFSGDGQWIVFRRGTRDRYDLYLMSHDGSNVRRLTDGGANYLDPVFSPTANRIAFISNRTAPSSVVYDVYLIELDDDRGVQSIRPITTTDGQEGHLAFSHDGEWLAFTSEQGGISDEQPLYPQPQAYGEIYALRLSDSTTIRLTHNKWEDGAPSWEKAAP